MSIWNMLGFKKKEAIAPPSPVNVPPPPVAAPVTIPRGPVVRPPPPHPSKRLPPQTSVTTSWSSFIQQAEVVLNHGDVAGASNLYQMGVQQLLIAIQNETNDVRKRELRAEADHYLRRAEFLKDASSNTSTLKQPHLISISNNTKHPIPRASPPRVSITAPVAGVDPDMQKIIISSVLNKTTGISFKDVAGMELVKQSLREAVILPLLRPDLFKGMRAPPKGILMFGPPGNGKTFIAKALATEAGGCRFFSMSCSSLTSKWVGESEKLVRSMFKIAAAVAPSIIFIDEVDSVLSARTHEEQESSRRLKTEFLVQLDGVGSSNENNVLILAATNRPFDLDDAVRRRFSRRIYVPLPDAAARSDILCRLLSTTYHTLSSNDIRTIVEITDGYSGSDLASVCREAAMMPLRCVPSHRLLVVTEKEVGPVTVAHLKTALPAIKPSVNRSQLKELEDWNLEFGLT